VSHQNQTGAHAFSDALVKLGVTHIFGMNTPEPIYVVLDPSIQAMTVHDERAGAVMADAFARVSGRIGVCGAIRGPGATNLISGLAEAFNASSSVLALVNDIATADLDRNTVQGIDHIRLFEQMTKWGRRIDTPDRVVEYLRYATRLATSGRPGPVVLSLPDSALLGGPATPVAIDGPAQYPRTRCAAADDLIQAAVQKIAQAKQAIIVCGGGVHISGAYAALQQFAELTQILVATTPLGKGAISEIHPLSAGVVGGYTIGQGARGEIANMAVKEADLVILIGTKTDSLATNHWTVPGKHQDIIHIDIDPQELGRNYACLEVVADARCALAQLSAAWHSAPVAPRPWNQTWQTQIQQWHVAFDAVHYEDGPVDPRQIYRKLNTLLKPEDIVTVDASYCSAWGMDLLQFKQAGRRFLAPRGFAGLGWGVPAAIGAQCARPDAQVYCMSGDGGFGYVAMEMETAARYKLPIRVIVLNNGILGFQQHYEIHRFGKSTQTTFTPLNYAQLAKTLNCHAIRVECASAVDAALQEAQMIRGPVLIDIVCAADARPPINTFESKAAQH